MRTTPVYTHPSRLFSVLLEQGGNNGHIVGILCVGQLVVDSVSHYHTNVLRVLIQQLSKYKHKKLSIQRTHSCLQIERIRRKLLASEHTEHSTSPISNANIRRNTLNVYILKLTSIYMYKFTILRIYLKQWMKWLRRGLVFILILMRTAMVSRSLWSCWLQFIQTDISRSWAGLASCWIVISTS